jgi:hypothetical protein
MQVEFDRSPFARKRRQGRQLTPGRVERIGVHLPIGGDALGQKLAGVKPNGA